MNTLNSKRGKLGTLATGVAALAAIASSCLPPAALAATEEHKADNACLFSVTINNWRALDSQNLVIWGPGRDNAYHVSLGFPLSDLRDVENIAVIDGNGDGRLCGFGMDEIVTNGISRQHSTVLGVTHLDAAALAALGEQYKVNLVPKKKDKPAS